MKLNDLFSIGENFLILNIIERVQLIRKTISFKKIFNRDETKMEKYATKPLHVDFQ